MERQKEGIEIAKREGKYKGGQVKAIDENIFQVAYLDYTNRKITKKHFAELLNISRPTLDKLLRERGLF